MNIEDLEELYPDLIYFGSTVERRFLDKAILGVGERCGQPPVLIYSYPRLVAAFELMNDWDNAQAVEWVDYNCTAWVGDHTPIIMYELDP